MADLQPYSLCALARNVLQTCIFGQGHHGGFIADGKNEMFDTWTVTGSSIEFKGVVEVDEFQEPRIRLQNERVQMIFVRVRRFSSKATIWPRVLPPVSLCSLVLSEIEKVAPMLSFAITQDHSFIDKLVHR